MDMPRWLNEKEAKEVTGDSLSTLRNNRHNGVGIPYYKVGKSVRYNLQEILDYMQSHRIATEDK